MPKPASTLSRMSCRLPRPRSISESDESSYITDDFSSSTDSSTVSPRTLRRRKQTNVENGVPRVVIQRAVSETPSPKASQRKPSGQKSVGDNYAPKSPTGSHGGRFRMVVHDDRDTDTTINSVVAPDSPRNLDSSWENTTVERSVCVTNIPVMKKYCDENSQNRNLSVFPSTSKDPQRLLNWISQDKSAGLSCTECPAVCLNMIGKLQHMLYQHSIMFCAKCEKPAKETVDVISHQCDGRPEDLTLSGEESQLILRTFCYLCSWHPHFSTYHSFRAHHRTVHPQLVDDILYACVVCGKGNRLYKKVSGLAWHYKQEHPNSEQAKHLSPYKTSFSMSRLSDVDKSLVSEEQSEFTLEI